MSIEVPFIILTLALPLYFLSRWLMKKRDIGNDSNRKYIAIIPALFISPIIYVIIIITWVLSASFYLSNDFNKEEWNNNKHERYKLTEDIIESKMLIGKTKDEVIEILGDDYNGSDSYIYYEIGHVPEMFNIDPSFLEIYFKNNIVEQVKQTE